MNFPPPTKRQARTIWLALTALAVALLIALLVALIWGLGKVLAVLSPVLWPLAVAAVIAYLLDPLVDFLERRNVPRPRAIVLVFVVAFALVSGVLTSLVPRVVVETRELASKVPEYTAKAQDRVEGWLAQPPHLILRLLPFLHKAAGISDVTRTNASPPGAVTLTNAVMTSTNSAPAGVGEAEASWQDVLNEKTVRTILDKLVSALPAIQTWILNQISKVGQIFGVFAGLALIPVYSFYLLLEKRGIAARWTEYLPVQGASVKEELVFVLRAINDYLIAFFRGQVLVAMCDGVLYTAGFFALGLNYAFLLGCVATVLTMIPFLGAITTCALALVLALVQFGDWWHLLGVLGVFAIVQTLEGLVISPKIMGDRVNLHPLVIIIAVMAGTTLLGGLLGGILAIPLAAALRVIMFRYVWKQREPQAD